LIELEAFRLEVLTNLDDEEKPLEVVEDDSPPAFGSFGVIMICGTMSPSGIEHLKVNSETIDIK
jgi:hypothetical protein